MKWLLKGSPYEVQSRALDLSADRPGFGFFMEMGLGKTATVLNEMRHGLDVTSSHEAQVAIVPNSMKEVWADQAEEWGADVPISIWPDVSQADRDGTLLIINWEALIGRGGAYLKDFLRRRDCYVAADESIHIKNPRSKRTKAFLSLCEWAKFVRPMSGKPIVQSPLDIWAQLRCIGGRVHPNPYAFRNKYCRMGGYMNKQIVGARNEEELNSRIEEVSFRATKAEWTDLPEKLYGQRGYEMSKKQKELYDDMLNDFMIELNDGSITAPMVITQLGKLQQIASGFIYDESGRGHVIVDPADNPKIKLLKEVAEEAGDKVIVFVKHKYSGEVLHEMLRPQGAVQLKGGMTSTERREAMAQFNEDSDVTFALCSYSAKYGVTLLGTESRPCRTTFYYENDFSLDARAQSEDRNHRHGQLYETTYLDAIGSPVEKKVVKALQRKENIVQSIMGRPGRV